MGKPLYCNGMMVHAGSLRASFCYYFFFHIYSCIDAVFVILYTHLRLSKCCVTESHDEKKKKKKREVQSQVYHT